MSEVVLKALERSFEYFAWKERIVPYSGGQLTEEALLADFCAKALRQQRKKGLKPND